MSDKSFFDEFLFGLTVGVTVTAIFFTTSHLIEENNQQRDEIKKLILRLEECEKNNESSQDS